MQLDDMKEAWAAHGALLARSVAIDERLLREIMLRKVRFALAPYVVCRALEVIVGIAALIAVMSVLVAHPGEPRYLLVGGTLAVFTIGLTVLCAYLLVNVVRLDRSGPVTHILREIERIQLAEYVCFKWALLGGTVLWLPALLVPFEALTGIDALARVHLSFLALNLTFGLAVLLVGQALSKRYVERPVSSARARRLVDALSGRGLRVASEHLAELARFTRDA
ncbi:MAG: hypothetical protein ACKVWV_19755 [Planctomycetota bacterium]